MAKVTLTFKNTPNGTLIKSVPDLGQLVVLAQSQDQPTIAQGYAMVAWRAVLAESNQAGKDAAVNVH